APTASRPVLVSPPGITDLAQVFHPLASGWRPSGTTLVVARAMVSGDITLVAVPLGPRGSASAPTPIVSFTPDSWALRRDGGALAVTVWTGHGGRIAIWDVRSGAARWLTADEPGTRVLTPVWSIDGASIYYLSTSDDLNTAGIFVIGADGVGRKQVRAPEARTSSLDGLTPDGKGIVWTSFGAGGTVEILDIATGVARHLENAARVASWRERQPRALLSVGGCCAGRPGGELVIWNDVALTSRVIGARGAFGDPAWGGGAWDPAGTRIAAVRFDNTSPYEGALVVIDTESGAVQPIPETRGVGHVLWLPEGIVFSRPLRIGIELMLLPNGGGPAVSVYQDSGLIQRIDVTR
ncbi:MAG: hypothetical protein M3O91_08185, partial [Chloroflexota bacterium]|nr:hypothetical protein [Chloroflexota bacterium]